MDPADVVSGVDDDGFARLFIADDGAVALQRAYRKSLKNHDRTIVFRDLVTGVSCGRRRTG